MAEYPRTAEQIIRSGDIGKCHIRELLDLAREMGLTVHTDDKRTVLALIKAEALNRGWLAR
jgi:hypothetical protein